MALQAHGATSSERSFSNNVSTNTAVHRSIWVVGFVAIVGLALAVNHFQNISLPEPLSAEQAGKFGFSEERALVHLNVLTSFGPKPVGSHNLDHAIEYILRVLESIKAKVNPSVYMEVEHFHIKPGRTSLQGGLFKGKTLAYSNLSHVLVRLNSKYYMDAEDNAILVSSHVDTVFTSKGGGDCGSCVSVMLELVRALSYIAYEFKHSVIFLFNTGEEEGLDGAHSFITQHPWSSSIKTFVDLEAMGAGGRAKLFQAGPDKWLVDVFAKVATRPSANIFAQDVFQAGLFKSATDFQVYREVAGLSGLDFAYVENGAVYHTRNDLPELVRPGSLQHLGDNMLPLLIEVASSSELSTLKTDNQSGKTEMVYFDILGRYMVTFTHDFANMLYTSLLVQSVMLLAGSLIRAKPFSLSALLIAAFGVFLTWVFSLTAGLAAAAVVPLISSHAVPYIAHPILALGLFGAPGIFGAALGHFFGYKILLKYLNPFISISVQRHAEAEKYMFKAVFLQWLLLSALGMYSGAGSSYITFVWLVIPAISYGLFESNLSERKRSKLLTIRTLLFGLPLPIILSTDMFLNLPTTLIGNLVRFDRHPGGVSPWVANAVIAVMISAIICLLLSYLLPYIHRGGGLLLILLTMSAIFILSLSIVSYELLPAFTRDVGKGTYAVHVIETNTEKSYISVSFTTPGGLGNKETQLLVKHGFNCGDTHNHPDFVSFNVKKGCSKPANLDENLWRDRPTLTLVNDEVLEGLRKTYFVLNTKVSHRWSLAIDTSRIQAFRVDMVPSSETLVPEEEIVGVDGWHIVQFASGRDGPKEFNIELIWQNKLINAKHNEVLLKLRTDINITTPELKNTFNILPEWCVLFGKSTSPYTLAYVSNVVI